MESSNIHSTISVKPRLNSGQLYLQEEYKRKIGSVLKVDESTSTANKLLFRMSASTGIPKKLIEIAQTFDNYEISVDDQTLYLKCDIPQAIPLWVKGVMHIIVGMLLLYLFNQFWDASIAMIDLFFTAKI